MSKQVNDFHPFLTIIPGAYSSEREGTLRPIDLYLCIFYFKKME